MNETVFRIILSGILAVAVVLFAIRRRRRSPNVFRASPLWLLCWGAFIFTFGIALVLAPFYANPEYFESNIPIHIGLIIVWLLLLLMLIFALSKRYVLKGNILLKKELASKDEYIDIDKITSIEYVDPGYERGTYYLANMSDGGCHWITVDMEDLDRLFYRMGQINDNIHFHFPIHHTGEGSFFDKLVDGGTIIAAVVYAVGFYMLLGRVFAWFQ
ncbi:MAG: hypothetical protein FWC64_12225 [Treponema sp.]|nr:hypothetical protein [Treponema sp.]